MCFDNEKSHINNLEDYIFPKIYTRWPLVNGYFFFSALREYSWFFLKISRNFVNPYFFSILTAKNENFGEKMLGFGPFYVFFWGEFFKIFDISFSGQTADFFFEKITEFFKSLFFFNFNCRKRKFWRKNVRIWPILCHFFEVIFQNLICGFLFHWPKKNYFVCIYWKNSIKN